MFKTMKVIICVIILIIGNGSCTPAPPCKDIESLDISWGEKNSNGSIIHEGIEYEKGSYWSREENNETVIYGCPCIKRMCIWKCCGPNMMYYNNTCTNTTQPEVNPFNPPVYNERTLVPQFQAHETFFYMHNTLCVNKFRGKSDDSEIYLQQDGRLLYIDSEGRISRYPATHFCLEMWGLDTRDSLQNIQLSVLVCLHDLENTDSDELHLVYAVGMAIFSVPFLIITVLVYSCIPELRNVHGKCLLAYCGGLIVAYSILIYLKTAPYETDTYNTPCLIMAFVIYYSFQTSFFWLNVMCFDIWKTFSGVRTSDRQRQTRRFVRYGVYAWGVPLLLTIITAIMHFTNVLPAEFKPRFTELNCWFPDFTPQLIYFYTPVLILVLCNVIFFSITAYHIHATCKETRLLNTTESSRNMTSRLDQHKQRYMLYVKLFVIMGVNWITELMSFFMGGNQWFWMVVDISNIAVGFAIFFVFVLRNKVVLRKWARCWGSRRPGLADSSTGRYTTHSSTAPSELTRITGASDKSA